MKVIIIIINHNKKWKYVTKILTKKNLTKASIKDNS